MSRYVAHRLFHPSSLSARHSSSSELRRLMAQHTIVLVQFLDKLSSRTFSDFESVEKAMDGVCQLFEQKLKTMHPNRHKITYDISELFEYLDTLKDLCCLVFDNKVNAYLPHNRDWIKQRVLSHLKQQAGQ